MLLSAVLDLKRLRILEKKIATLKALLAAEEEGGDLDQVLG